MHPHSRFIAFTSPGCGHSVLGQDIRQPLVELQGPGFGESVPQHDADDGVRFVAHVTLVVSEDDQEELFAGLSPQHPLCSWAAFAGPGLSASECNLQDTAVTYPQGTGTWD